MTTIPAASAGPAPPSDPDRGPVIVLSCAPEPARLTRSILEFHPGLVCTASTGLLPLCDQAAAIWRHAEGKPGGAMSGLAAASVRALCSTLMTVLVSGAGNGTWCEFASAAPSTARTFLQLYPRARLVCLHQACEDAVAGIWQASPWGLDGAASRFTAAYPGSTAAAITAYWAWYTSSLLDLEDACPTACLRVRHEDLPSDPAHLEASWLTLLGLTRPATPSASPPATPRPPAPQANTPRPPFPAGQLPPGLLAQVNDLSAQLGYPPIGRAGTTQIPAKLTSATNARPRPSPLARLP